MLLSLLALGGSAFTWYQTQVASVTANSHIAVGVTEIGGQVSRIGDTVQQLQQTRSQYVSQEQLTTRLLENTHSIDNKLRDLTASQQNLNRSIDKINKDLAKGLNELLIDEVSQLLKLANNHVLFANNPALAIKALELADTQLKELADPRYATVRKQLNAEINLLQAAKTPDSVAIVAKLQAIAQRIPKLKLENEPPIQAAVVVEQNKTETLTWRTELRKVWHDIINSVQINRVDKPPKPLLAPTQRYFLDENIVLNLNKAEWAVLLNNASVYQSSLDQALVWLADYFDSQDADVQSIVAQLKTLKNEPLGIALPSISASYDALQSIKGGQ